MTLKCYANAKARESTCTRLASTSQPKLARKSGSAVSSSNRHVAIGTSCKDCIAFALIRPRSKSTLSNRPVPLRYRPSPKTLCYWSGVSIHIRVVQKITDADFLDLAGDQHGRHKVVASEGGRYHQKAGNCCRCSGGMPGRANHGDLHRQVQLCIHELLIILHAALQ